MAADEITRVRYTERQYLRAEDFVAEQRYHADDARRHVLAHHTWGIVTGLELVEVPDSTGTAVEVWVMPGLATDGYGRKLVVFHPRQLTAEDFAAFTSDAHQQVWLSYEEATEAPPGAGWADCEDGQPTRSVEEWRIVISPGAPYTGDVIVDGRAASTPPAPAGEPEMPEDASVPYQELPDAGGGARWLVRLGSVRWDGPNQRFVAADAGALSQERRYAGAVADHVLSPTSALRIAARDLLPADDRDAADFATVDGRLRVIGRVNAERELWMEGDPIRFTYDAGAENGTELTLVREPGPSPGSHRLRLRLGDTAVDTTDLSIGTGTATSATDILRVRADDVVAIATGRLEFGAGTRQMIDLWASAGGHEYGIGVQSSTLYQRSAGEFAWFRGGEHADGALDPGAGGQLQLRLDVDGSLNFGTRVRQMLNLWDTFYGVGVQTSTLYFRTNFDVCWFRGGTHSSVRGDPGGGTLAMKLDDTGHLRVYGSAATSGTLTVGAGADAIVQTRHVHGKASGSDGEDSLYLNYGTGHEVVVGQPGGTPSDLHVSGTLTVDGGTDLFSVVQVQTYERFVKNSPGTTVWTQSLGTDFSHVYGAFAVLQGFSYLEQTDAAFSNVGHDADVDMIIQHVVLRVTSVSNTQIVGTSYCAQSDASREDNNTVLFTVVVIGRKV